VKDDAVRRVTVETKIPSGRWLSGFDVSPGERRALRSAFLFVKEQSGREQWIGGWTPWHAMTRAPSNTGYRLPAGAELLLELHYKSTEPGKTLVDDSALGLYLQSNPPRSVIQDVHVNRETTLKQDLMVWALKPELTGGSIEARAIIPDGRIEPLLWVKNNSTDWQLPYVLRDPVRLPRGTRIISKGAALSVLAYPPH